MSRPPSSRPKVTIGVCVRNSAETLIEAIESIRDQDYPHELLEVIFVDDGSQDETSSVIDEYSSSVNATTNVIHTKWSGLGHARNLVLSKASGHYIVWVDGDMVLSKDFVRQLVDHMERNPSVGVAKGKQDLQPGGNLLATLETYSRAVGRMIDYNSSKGRYRALGTGGSIYRTKVIERAQGFDEKLRGYGEDWDAEIRIRAGGWLLDTVDVRFSDYEKYKITWKSLWRRYWLRGYHSHFFLHKNRGLIKHYRMFPPAAFLNGIFQSRLVFRLTNDTEAFLLPLQHVFKTTAWYVGFMQAHLEGYQP